MKHLKITPIMLLLTFPAFADTLSLELARSLMLQHNGTLAAARDSVLQATEDANATKSLRYPSVQLNAMHIRMNDDVQIDLNPIRSVMLALHPQIPDSAVPSFEMDVQKASFNRGSLNVEWPLFAGGRIHEAIRAADVRAEISRTHRQQVEENLQNELVRRYYALALARKALDVYTDVADGSRRRFDQARKLETAGMIAKVERLHAEMAASEADREVKAARRDVLLATTALSSLIGSDATDVSSPLFVAALDPLETYTRSALAGNSALKQLEETVDLARCARRAEIGQWLPTVYLFGNRELFVDDLTMLDPDWSAGIGLTWNIFDGFERNHRVAAAGHQLNRIEHIREQSDRDIRALVEKHYTEAAKAAEQFDALSSSIETARENLRVRERAFAAGMGTSLEVVDAQNLLSAAELERYLAAYQHVTALAGLLSESGMIDRYDDYRQHAAVEAL